jgi:hypothetical protein
MGSKPDLRVACFPLCDTVLNPFHDYPEGFIEAYLEGTNISASFVLTGGAAAELATAIRAALVFRATAAGTTNLNLALGKATANLVRDVLKGRQSLSSLTHFDREIAAAYYRGIATRTVGRNAVEASSYNIARAEFLEGTRTLISPSIAEFMANGF